MTRVVEAAAGRAQPASTIAIASLRISRRYQMGGQRSAGVDVVHQLANLLPGRSACVPPRPGDQHRLERQARPELPGLGCKALWADVVDGHVDVGGEHGEEQQ